MSSVHNNQAMELFRRKQRIDPQQIRLFRNAYYKKGESFEVAALQIPARCRSLFWEQFSSLTLSLEEEHHSQQDGATKLLLRTATGHLIETVILRIDSGRTSLCVSSQVGCAAGCQ
ncbi:23S rRNA (adenine(2503)-C(2))-methyltransferase @ tRNA (adenine(37)-C(2))-methyltransferase, partial [hydrothermal vent metagenome]